MASIKVGISECDITPPINTPSAGYMKRMGKGMLGTHDPLYAITLVIDNGEKKLAFCSVDHLGFTYEMVQEITKKIHSIPTLSDCEIYLGSSHTHSGGGAYLNIPIIGESLAGTFDREITQFYIDKTTDSILAAFKQLQPAKIGIGYGYIDTPLSCYRGAWPENVQPLQDIAIIKVTRLDGAPLAVLFNYPLHPTVLDDENMYFSADFVGYTRKELQSYFQPGFKAIYFNGAQGEIIPNLPIEGDRFAYCEQIGHSLARSVLKIWEETSTDIALDITTKKEPYLFQPKPTPFGLELPLKEYQSEVNLIILNRSHAFITIPGELSCLYDQFFKKIGSKLGFEHVSILGLVNDAHGYIILPEAWRRKTFESSLSFGGEKYGDDLQNMILQLFQCLR